MEGGIVEDQRRGAPEPQTFSSASANTDPLSQPSLHSAYPEDERQQFIHQIREANEQLVGSALRAQEAYDEADLRFRNLVEGLDAIVWEAEADTGRFTFVSQQAQALFGYPVHRWLEERNFWIALIHPEDREQTLKCYKAALERRQGFQVEFRAMTADGRTLWLSQRARLKPASRPDQLLGLMVDITAQKRSEQRLHQAIKDHQAMEVTLREKLEELEKFHEMVVGRELKMIALEREVLLLKKHHRVSK
jgi:PAS domain S-box-containing protein